MSQVNLKKKRYRKAVSFPGVTVAVGFVVGDFSHQPWWLFFKSQETQQQIWSSHGHTTFSFCWTGSSWNPLTCTETAQGERIHSSTAESRVFSECVSKLSTILIRRPKIHEKKTKICTSETWIEKKSCENEHHHKYCIYVCKWFWDDSNFGSSIKACKCWGHFCADGKEFRKS